MRVCEVALRRVKPTHSIRPRPFFRAIDAALRQHPADAFEVFVSVVPRRVLLTALLLVA